MIASRGSESQRVSVAFHHTTRSRRSEPGAPRPVTECSGSRVTSWSQAPVLRRWLQAAVAKIIGQPRPTSRRRLPVKLAVMFDTSPRQAMSASTANSGRVWSQARRARARPWLMKNCATSAAQAITKAERRTGGEGPESGRRPRPPPPAPAALLAVAAHANRIALNIRPPPARRRRLAVPHRRFDLGEPRSSAFEQRVSAKTFVVGLGEVASIVCAAALLAEEGRGGHGPRHVREVARLGLGAAFHRGGDHSGPSELFEQALEARGIALETEGLPGPAAPAPPVERRKSTPAALPAPFPPDRALRPSRRRRAPKTRPSSNELLARRFAPCTPVPAHSPAA